MNENMNNCKTSDGGVKSVYIMDMNKGPLCIKCNPPVGIYGDVNFENILCDKCKRDKKINNILGE